MLHDENSGRKIAWNLREHKLERVWTARGNSDGDDAVWRKRSASGFFRNRLFFDLRDLDALAAGAFCHFYLFNQLSGNRIEISRGCIFWLRDEIDCAEGECFES